MLFNEKYDYMVSCRNKTKKNHENHLKISPRTRIWYKKEIILKRKRHKAKKKLKRYKKKLQYIDKYRKRIKRLQNEINELHVSSNKDVDTMYNSLENIATCSNHSSVQHFLRQSEFLAAQLSGAICLFAFNLEFDDFYSHSLKIIIDQ